MRPGADPGVSGGRGGCQSGTPIQTISWHPSILEMRCCQRAKSPHSTKLPEQKGLVVRNQGPTCRQGGEDACPR